MTLFGTLPNGTEVHQITLKDGNLECDIITYGGALKALRCPDRDGNSVDILLGFDSLDAWTAQDKYIGALIGRFGNRIGGASFELDGVTYNLTANDGPNTLHGGPQGFDKQVWKVEKETANAVTLSLVSPDGHENFPGTLTVYVTYTLEDNALRIDYQATTDKKTLCNLTNHAYFNLSGHNSGTVLDQQIQLFADHYTFAGPGSIPTGEIASVEGTPMDLRQPTAMGQHIDDAFDQLTAAGGYDHNWCVNGKSGELRPAARAYSPKTGIAMETLTDLPGIQFYAGNYLDGCPAGKGGAPYAKRWGFCLETQLYPDAPHHDNFQTALLEPGQVYKTTTIYRLWAE